MTFQEAKESLKNIFLDNKIEVADEHERELFFKLRHSGIFKLNESDIQDYANAKSANPALEKKPTETCLVNQNYREQMIQFLHPTRARFIPPRDIDILFGEENHAVPYVRISKASSTFIWLNLSNEAFFDLIINRIRFRYYGHENIDFTENIYKPLTIKVYNINENSIDSAIKASSRLIDACAFSYSSLKDNPIGLAEEWPRRKSRLKRDFEFGPVHRGNNFNLPSIKFNSHLVRFYQLAASKDIESIKFLSYYHILEYHFVSISDHILYNKISRRINDLKFKTTADNLDRIIQDVNDHRSETDETEMLKNVLNKLVIEDELIDFIKSYEEFLNNNLYTKKHTLFGIEIPGTNLQPGHVFGTIAKHIKTLRNALVHSSDRHERNLRFIPYSVTSSELIKKEIPLVRFLAEKVIIATAK